MLWGTNKQGLGDEIQRDFSHFAVAKAKAKAKADKGNLFVFH